MMDLQQQSLILCVSCVKEKLMVFHLFLLGNVSKGSLGGELHMEQPEILP